MSQPKFSHSITTYVFVGEKLTLPAPGTYDPTNYTPPTHRTYEVMVSNDGFWQLSVLGTKVRSGDFGDRSRAFAKNIIERWITDRARDTA